jgi:hypothetical protein
MADAFLPTLVILTILIGQSYQNFVCRYQADFPVRFFPRMAPNCPSSLTRTVHLGLPQLPEPDASSPADPVGA